MARHRRSSAWSGPVWTGHIAPRTAIAVVGRRSSPDAFEQITNQLIRSATGSITGVCLANGVSGGSLAGFGGGESVAEGDGEGVDGWLPSHRPSGSADPGRVQGPGDQVEAL